MLENIKHLEKHLVPRELYWNLPVQYYNMQDFLELLYSYHIVKIGPPYNNKYFDIDNSSLEVLTERITTFYNDPTYSHYTDSGYVVTERIPKSNMVSYLARVRLYHPADERSKGL